MPANNNSNNATYLTAFGKCTDRYSIVIVFVVLSTSAGLFFYFAFRYRFSPRYRFVSAKSRRIPSGRDVLQQHNIIGRAGTRTLVDGISQSPIARNCVFRIRLPRDLIRSVMVDAIITPTVFYDCTRCFDVDVTLLLHIRD